MSVPSSLGWANEVAVVVGLPKAPAGLRAEHVGLFWHLIREEYSEVQVALPPDRVLRPGLFASASGVSVGPGRPFRLSSMDGTHDLFVQRDRFGVWWHLDSGEGVDFPGVVRPGFDRLYGFFDSFLIREFRGWDMRVDFCELSFGGAFAESDDSLVGSEVVNWLKEFQVPGLEVSLAGRPEFDFSYYYDLSSGLHVEVGGQCLLADGRPSEVEFTFQMEGSQRLGNATGAEVSSWLGSAYSELTACYESLVR